MKAINLLYSRSSTTEQNNEYQLKIPSDLKDNETKEFIDKISGVIKFSNRPQAKKLLQFIESNPNVKLMVIFESVDRVGRNTVDILQTIEKLKSYPNVNIYITSINQYAFTNDKENLTFEIILNVLGSIASMDYKERRRKQAAGITAAKEKNLYTGRIAGSKESSEKFYAKYEALIKDINRGKYNVTELSKMHSKTRAQIYRIIARHGGYKSELSL